MLKQKRALDESSKKKVNARSSQREEAGSMSLKRKKMKNQSLIESQKDAREDVSDDEMELPASLKTKKMKRHVVHKKDTASEDSSDALSEENEESLSEHDKSSLSDGDDSEIGSDQDIQMSPTKKVKGHMQETEAMSSSRKKMKNKRKSLNPDNETTQTADRQSPVKSKKANSRGFVLFVGQIPHHITKKDIERHFSPSGGLKDVRLLIYQDSGRSRGCAYVEFVDKEHMKLALKLNESTLGGAKIKVEYPYQGGKKYGGAKTSKPKGKKWKKNNF